MIVLFGALWWGAGGAVAAQPVKGGHYVFVRTLGSDVLGGGEYYVSVELTLANDGHELAQPSLVGEHVACGKTNGVIDGMNLSRALDAPFRAVAIGSDGRFSASETGPITSFSVSGRFVDGGKAAVGTVVIRAHMRSCPQFRLAFRAPLVGRPNAVHAGRHSVCDRVTIRQLPRLGGQDEAYRVYDKGIGCTTARELARGWRASPTCQRLAPGGICQVSGGECRAVVGGQFNGLVSARCTARGIPDGIAELVHYNPCGPPKSSDPAADITMWAVNVGCATAAAFPVDTLVGDTERATGPCGDIYSLPFTSTACSPVAGYACRARNADFGPEAGFYAVCVQQLDGFRALVFYDEV